MHQFLNCEFLEFPGFHGFFGQKCSKKQQICRLKRGHNAFVNYCNNIKKIIFQHQDVCSSEEFKRGSGFAIKHELKLRFHGVLVVQSQGTRDEPV